MLSGISGMARVEATLCPLLRFFPSKERRMFTNQDRGGDTAEGSHSMSFHTTRYQRWPKPDTKRFSPFQS